MPTSDNPGAGGDITPPFAHFIDYDAKDSPEDVRRKLFSCATLVDTTLFRAYMLVSPSLAGSLFRLDNFCSANVVEEKLYASGRYNELIDFLWGKKLHEEALKLLERFGKDENLDEALEDFRGPQRTVQYLQQLPFTLIDLILQYAKWPMETEPETGMQVFLADTENAESLSRTQVVEFLEAFDPIFVIKYLEHITSELADSTLELHDRLVELYVARIKAEAAGHDGGGGTASWQEKLEQFLKTSRHYEKNKVLKWLPTQGQLREPITLF